MKITKTSTLAIAACIYASSVHGVIPFLVTTDNESNMSHGTWMGDGMVQPDVEPGVRTGGDQNAGNPPGPRVLVSNFNSGTLSIPLIGANPTGFDLNSPPSGIYAGGDPRFKVETGVSHSIQLNSGGTGNLRLHNSNTFDGGAELFNSTGITNLVGVNSISWTITFTEPVATRNTELGSVTTRPLGAGLAVIDAGGSDLDDFRVGMSFGGITSAPTVNGTFTAGVQPDFRPVALNGLTIVGSGTNEFDSPNGFVLTNRFAMVRGWSTTENAQGDPTLNEDEVPLHYITSQTWTIELEDGSDFGSDTLFVFSMDGQQYDNITAVPEPQTFALLLALAGAAVVVTSRRQFRRG